MVPRNTVHWKVAQTWQHCVFVSGVKRVQRTRGFKLIFDRAEAARNFRNFNQTTLFKYSGNSEWNISKNKSPKSPCNPLKGERKMLIHLNYSADRSMRIRRFSCLSRSVEKIFRPPENHSRVSRWRQHGNIMFRVFCGSILRFRAFCLHENGDAKRKELSRRFQCFSKDEMSRKMFSCRIIT